MCHIDHKTLPQTVCNIGQLSWWGECAYTLVDHASYWSMMLAWSPSHSISSRWLGLTLLKGLATPYRMNKPSLLDVVSIVGHRTWRFGWVEEMTSTWKQSRKDLSYKWRWKFLEDKFDHWMMKKTRAKVLDRPKVKHKEESCKFKIEALGKI